MDEWESWGSAQGTKLVKDGLEPGVEYSIQVRAISATGVPADQWSDEFALIIETDETPPPIPDAPTATSRFGLVTVTWNGKADDGLSGMPADFLRCDVWQEGVADPIGTLSSSAKAQFVQLANLSRGSSHRFRLTAIDRSGNVSDPGAWSAAVVVNSVLDETDIAEGIEDIAIAAASGASGEKSTYSLSDPPTTGNEDRLSGDRWFKLNVSGQTIGWWHWDGVAWVADQLTNAVIANIDAGKITTGTLSTGRLAAGSISADKLNVGTFNGVTINGLTITGATVSGGSIATTGRTAWNDDGTGVFIRPDGVASFRGVSTPASTNLLLVNPAAANPYVLIGGYTGSRIQFEENGRMRSWTAANTLFMDFNPALGSQNARISGALLVDTLNIGTGTGGAVYGIIDATTSATTVSAVGSNRAVNLSPSGNGHINLNCGGTGQVRSMTVVGDFITHATAAAMVARTDTGQIGMAGSSRRFKVAIDDHDFAGDILSLSPRSWYDRREAEKYVEMLDNIAAGIDPTEEELAEITRPLDPGYGLVAEEVEAAGLGEFVLRDGKGEIISLAYERLWIPLIPAVRELRARIANLESQLENQ